MACSAFAHDGNALIGATSHVDLGLSWLPGIHATDAHLEARTLVRCNPTSGPDRNRHLVLMERVATEDRLLGNQRTAVVAQAPKYEAIVFEQDSFGERTSETRDRQDLSRGNDHRLRAIARIGHDINAHRSPRTANASAPRGVSGIFFDKGTLKRPPHGGVRPRKLDLVHDHRFGRVNARPTSKALRWRATTERSRRAP